MSETVDTAACVEVVRALVQAFEEKGNRLSRRLRHEYKPESDLEPGSFIIRTELIEQGMKALGLPVPEMPKPKKIPAVPSPAQAKVLETMAADGARLKQWRSIWDNDTRYCVVNPAGGDDGRRKDVARATYWKLHDFGWITCKEQGDTRHNEYLYVLTDAGREALARYQTKRAAPA